MKILLVCSAGMSTSMLVKKMQEEAVKQNIDTKIWAVGIADGKTEAEKADIVLLGPQIRYMEAQMKTNVAGRIPVSVIDMLEYGRLNGKAVLDKAIKLVEANKK